MTTPENVQPAAPAAPVAPAAPAAAPSKPVDVKTIVAAAKAHAAANPSTDEQADDALSLQDEPLEVDGSVDQTLADKATKERGEAYELKVPDFVPLKELTPEREQYVEGFKYLAPSLGIPSGTAQSMVEAFVDVATQITYSPPDEYTSPEDAFADMEKVLGPQQAKALADAAQRYVAKRGGGMGAWLNQTGLGNDIGVITALALAESGYFDCGRETAQKRLATIMNSKEYAAGDNLTVVKVQVLSRIANREPTLATAKPLHPQQALGKANAQSQESLRSELAAMMKPGTPLMDAGHRDHATAVAAYHKLLARLA